MAERLRWLLGRRTQVMLPTFATEAEALEILPIGAKIEPRGGRFLVVRDRLLPDQLDSEHFDDAPTER